MSLLLARAGALRACRVPHAVRHGLLLAALLSLAACASKPGASTAGGSAGAGGGTSATASTAPSGGLFDRWFGRPPEGSLGALRDNMASAVRGTPVGVDMQGDDLVLLTVPLQNSFDAGRAAVRPALGAVLDRLAGELRSVPAAQVAVAGPPDANGGALLAQDRAAAARDFLVSRGVAATRFAGLSRAGAAAVEIRVSTRLAALRPTAR